MVKLVRWTPVARRTPSAFDQLFDDLLAWDARPAHAARPILRPAMDVLESEAAFTVALDLPGLSPDAVNVEIHDGVLAVSGEIAQDEADADGKYAYRERRRGGFKRSLRLGDQIDAANVEATFDNGVLTLVLPKLPEAQPRRIEVQRA